MDSYEIKCKNCGRKLLTYSKSSFQKYKSPVKKCKKCGTRYVDPRCHEIAIEVIPADIFNIPTYLILILIGAFILYRGIRLSGMHQLGTSDEMQWLMPTVIVLVGAIMVIGGIVEIITIVTNIKAKRFEKLWLDSERRLEDKNYVYILQGLGYEIPEKYL